MDIDNMAKWNTTVSESRKIKTLSSDIFIVNQVTHDDDDDDDETLIVYDDNREKRLTRLTAATEGISDLTEGGTCLKC